MTPENVMAITTLLAMVAGLILKNRTALNNKLIPVVLLAFMGIKNFLVTVGWLTPEMAPMIPIVGAMFQSIGVAGGLQLAGWGWLAGIGASLLPTLIEAVIPVGLHSFIKNTFQGAMQRELKKPKGR